MTGSIRVAELVNMAAYFHHAMICCVWSAATVALFSAHVTSAALATTPDYVRPSNEPSKCQCIFRKHNYPDSFMKKIEPLCGNRYPVEDEFEDGYSYTIGICTSAELNPSSKTLKTGALQTEKKKTPSGSNRQYSVGSFEEAEVMIGNTWMILEYEGGDKFGSHCSSENRRTVIMITCKEGETEGVMRWVEANNNKSSDCYYLFELDHEAACVTSPSASSGLSIGAVITIVVTVFAGVYLIGGFLFMRFIRGAKGLNQIPNYSFWRDFGALQADGCDLVCRCGGGTRESKYYHGIGDHQIESAAENEQIDDNLLPM